MSPQTAASGCGLSSTNQCAGSGNGLRRVDLQHLDGVLVGELLAFGGFTATGAGLPPPPPTDRVEQCERRPRRRDQHDERPFGAAVGVAFDHEHREHDQQREHIPRDDHRRFRDEREHVHRKGAEREERPFALHDHESTIAGRL